MSVLISIRENGPQGRQQIVDPLVRNVREGADPLPDRLCRQICHLQVTESRNEAMVDRRTVTSESRDGKCPLHCIKPFCKSHGDEDAFVLVLVLPEIFRWIECALGDLEEDGGTEAFGIFQVLLRGFQF